MSKIQCCKGCAAPKRHVGCHADCPVYLAEVAVIKNEPVDEAYVYLYRKRFRMQRYLRNKGRD